MIARFEPASATSGPSTSSYVIVALLRAAVGLAAFVAFTGVVLWGALVLSGIETSLKTLLIVATYAGTVRVVFGLAVLVVLVLRGVESVTSSADLNPSLGLDLLLPEDSGTGPGLSAALAGLSVFSLWRAYLVGLGVQTTHRLRRSWIFVVAALMLGLPFLYHIVVASHLGGAPPSFIQRVEQ